jgi:predicted nucleic acid-binding protein
MKLVIDASILIAALLKKSETRRIMLHPLLELHCPAYLKEEVEEHRERLREAADLGKLAFAQVLKTLMEHIIVHPEADYQEKMEKAKEIIGKIDEADIPYIALTLAIEADGIWSNDRHFQQQTEIIVISTSNLIIAFPKNNKR